jgi:uncharacterized protein YpbB
MLILGSQELQDLMYLIAKDIDTSLILRGMDIDPRNRAYTIRDIFVSLSKGITIEEISHDFKIKEKTIRDYFYIIGMQTYYQFLESIEL